MPFISKSGTEFSSSGREIVFKVRSTLFCIRSGVQLKFTPRSAHVYVKLSRRTRRGPISMEARMPIYVEVDPNINRRATAPCREGPSGFRVRGFFCVVASLFVLSLGSVVSLCLCRHVCFAMSV